MISPLVVAAAGLGLLVGTVCCLVLDRLYSDAPLQGPLRSPRSWSGLLAPATALLFAFAALRGVDARHFALMAVFGSVLLALTATDIERHLLPNRVVYPAVVLAVAVSWAWPGRELYSGILGGIIGAALMFVVFLILPGFGLGDVKLAGLIGLILGHRAVLTGLLAGMLFGGIGAAVLLLTRRATLRSAIAYGPYLASGAILVMLGPNIPR